ncbi:nuclear transport factor 2 family protein [bacterium]|nr:nuclear transport factor 2 family protein [bacterium]
MLDWLMPRIELVVLLSLALLSLPGCKQDAPVASVTPKVTPTQVPVPKPPERKFTAAQMRAALERQYATLDKALHVRDPDTILDLFSRGYRENGRVLDRNKLKRIIEKDFAEALKLENEVGAIDMRNPVKILKVTPLGPTRCKVHYRHTRIEEAYELRIEKEFDTTDVWQFESDEEWRIVESLDDKPLRHQKFINGKLKANLPLEE